MAKVVMAKVVMAKVVMAIRREMWPLEVFVFRVSLGAVARPQCASKQGRV